MSSQQSNYKNRAKLNKKFYFNLLKVFLVTALICGSGLGFLWAYLSNYEKTTPNGAIVSYFKLIKKKDWEAVYEESKKVFPQFNNEEVYNNYINDLYGDVDVSKAVFSKKSYSTDEFLYYDVIIDNNVISTLELTQLDNSNVWYARTLVTQRYFNFDALTPDTKFTVNNITITDDFLQHDSIICKAYDGNMGTDNLDLDYPYVKRYLVNSIIGIPDVSVEDPENYIVVKDALQDWYYGGPRVDDETFKEYSTLIEDTAIVYCEYITADTTYYNLRKYLYPNTDFYEAVSSFSNQWFSNHDSIAFTDVNVFDVVELGDNGFIGSISFDYIVKADSAEQVYSSTYQMTFLKDEKGNHLLTNLVIAE